MEGESNRSIVCWNFLKVVKDNIIDQNATQVVLGMMKIHLDNGNDNSHEKLKLLSKRENRVSFRTFFTEGRLYFKR